MNYTIPYPHEKQREVFVSPARFKILNWGRRSGKSMGLGMYIMLKAIEKQGNYYIIAPTYRQAKSIFWADIIKLLVPGAIINDSNENELFIELKPMRYRLPIAKIWGHDIDVQHDETKPPSRIYLKGADNPDSLRGVALDGAVLDEFAFMRNSDELWNKIIRPALADRIGWAVFSSTPNGIHNVFFDFVRHAQDPVNVDVAKPEHTGWFYSHCTALDNPYFDKQNTGEWEMSRRDHEQRGKIDEFVQEWEAQFTTPGKLVYKYFKQDTHVVHPQAVPQQGTYAIGIDFGWNDPFAVVFVLIDFDGNWWVYDEIYQTEMDTDMSVSAMQAKMGDKYFTRIIADNENKTEINNLKKRGIPARPASKGGGSIKGGISIVRALLKVREATGKPKLFITSNCKAIIREIESYSYLPNAWGEVGDIAEDKNNHLLDALRYIALDLDQKGKAPRKQQKRYDPVTGRLIS